MCSFQTPRTQRHPGLLGYMHTQRKKCRKERVGLVATNPDNLESNKEAWGGHKVLRTQVGFVQVECVPSVAPDQRFS